MVENLHRKMTQWLLGPLDEFPRVRFRKGNTQVLSSSLPHTLLARLEGIFVMCILGECIQVSYQTCQIFVGHIRFEAQFMLEGNGEGQDEVDCGSVLLANIPFIMHLEHTVSPEDPVFPAHLPVQPYRSILSEQDCARSESEETSISVHRPIYHR